MSTPFPPEEGIGNYVYNVSRRLIERGHKVTVITRGSLKRSESDVFDGIEVFRAPFIPAYPLHVHLHGSFVNRLFSSLEEDFDLIHIHTPLSPIIRTSLPVVSTIHTSLIEDARHIEVIDFRSLATKLLTRFISYSLVLRLIENSDFVTTVSNSVSEELKEYYGMDKSIVVGNGVDEKVFTPGQDKVEEKYILYTGRLSYRKGLFDLLECGRQICKDYPDISFILTGKGPLLGKLQKRAFEMKLNEKFKFAGYVEKERLIKLYQNAMVSVLPSYYEGLPTVLLEAMSCGLPVVATDISGNTEVIEDGKNGLLIPPKSPLKLAETISELLEDEKLREKLGRNARETIKEKYTWNTVTNGIEYRYKLAV